MSTSSQIEHQTNDDSSGWGLHAWTKVEGLLRRTAVRAAGKTKSPGVSTGGESGGACMAARDRPRRLHLVGRKNNRTSWPTEPDTDLRSPPPSWNARLRGGSSYVSPPWESSGSGARSPLTLTSKEHHVARSAHSGARRRARHARHHPSPLPSFCPVSSAHATSSKSDGRDESFARWVGISRRHCLLRDRSDLESSLSPRS